MTGRLQLTADNGGAELRLLPDYPGGRLAVALTQAPVTIAAELTREQVQELALALDDYLFDTRPPFRSSSPTPFNVLGSVHFTAHREPIGPADGIA